MIIESILTGLRNLFANKLRSVLSMLGIIFGVGTLVATMSIGEGTKRQILETIEAFGSNVVTLEAEFTRVHQGIATPGLVLRDAELIKEHSPLVERVTPIKSEIGIISYGGKKIGTRIVGTGPDFQGIRNFHVERGRFITQRDIDETAKVCVIGADLSERFEVEDLLGSVLEAKGGSLHVVGIMERRGSARRGALNEDMVVITPVTTVAELSSMPERIDQILIQAVSSALVEKTRDQVEELVKHFHGGHADFSISTQEEKLRKRREYAEVFKIALGSIAIVSLIIGGIGIMNILLVSVNERIKEIGIRKALGANPMDILLQFLSESFILTITGGIIGVVVGKVMGSRIAPMLTQHLPQRTFEWRSITSPDVVVIAFLFALVTGFIFGLYPAVKASRLDPSEALTYE